MKNPLSSQNHLIYRFIEVKAVNIEYPRFYWSRNEVQKAKMFGIQYWLYLIYYDKIKEFNVVNVERIAGPYETIFRDASVWKRQIENYSFSK